jgi:hypothetical protein
MHLQKPKMKTGNIALLLLFLCAGCFSEHTENQQPLIQTDFAALQQMPLPFAATPEEAIRQLQEGNARFAHQELRMQEPGRDIAAARKNPFAAVVHLCELAEPLHLIFDQPQGSLLQKSSTGKGPQDWKKVMQQWTHQPSLKLIVLLRQEGCAAPQEATVLSSAIRRLSSAKKQVHSFVLMEAVYHPRTRRVEFGGWQKIG